MSFSKEVKEELSKLTNLANKKELKLEFLGYLESNHIEESKKYIKYSTESDYNIDRFAKIIRNLGIENFKIDICGKVFCIVINKKDVSLETFDFNTEIIDDMKSFIRGLFMGSGSINNPENKYHLEFRSKKYRRCKEDYRYVRNCRFKFKTKRKYYLYKRRRRNI